MTVNGGLAILFGALSLFATGTMLTSLSMYFGLLVLIGGFMLLFGAFDLRRRGKNYSIMMSESIISIVIGALIMIFPDQSLRLFLIFIGVWAVALGLFKVFIALSFGRYLEYRMLLIIGGVLIVAIGLGLLLNPAYFAGVVLKITGAIFIVIGMLLVFFSFVIKNSKIEEN